MRKNISAEVGILKDKNDENFRLESAWCAWNFCWHELKEKWHFRSKIATESNWRSKGQKRYPLLHVWLPLRINFFKWQDLQQHRYLIPLTPKVQHQIEIHPEFHLPTINSTMQRKRSVPPLSLFWFMTRYPCLAVTPRLKNKVSCSALFCEPSHLAIIASLGICEKSVPRMAIH